MDAAELCFNRDPSAVMKNILPKTQFSRETPRAATVHGMFMMSY
jgi:hypothetical protein